MKRRLKVYTISLVVFLLVTTLAAGLHAPEALYNLYPLWANPLIEDEKVARIIEDSGVEVVWLEVVWLRVVPGSHATIAVSLPRGGFTDEQATAIGTAMGTLGRQYNLQSQILWVWIGRPANLWMTVVCTPAKCNPPLVDVHLDAGDWRRLIVERGWVR